MTSIAQSQSETRTATVNPWLILAIGLFTGSFAGPFIKLSQMGGLPSPVVASGRMLLAAIIVTPFVWRYYRTEILALNRRDILMSMLAGIFLQMHFQLFIVALETTSILVVTVLLNTGPIWVALLERFFLKARLNKYVWFGLTVTISGGMYIALSSQGSAAGSSVSIFGAVLTLLGSIAGACTLVVGRSVRQKVSIFPYIWIVFGFGGVMGVVYALLTSTPIFGHPATGYFWLVLLTLIPQLIGHSAFNFVLGYIPATMISLTAQLITILASVIAFFWFAEVPTGNDLIGSVIIIAGVTIAILYRNHHKHSTGEGQAKIGT